MKIPALLTSKETSRRDSDTQQIERHIRYSSLSRALYPKDKYHTSHFNPC